jgi:hypothetical protein
MRVRAHPASSLALILLLLAGCSAKAPAGGVPEAASEAAPSPSASEGASASAAPAPSTEPVRTSEPDARRGVFTATHEGNWTASAGVAGGQNFAGSGNSGETVASDGLTGVVVEMAWTASTPLSDSLRLQVFREGKPLLAEASGPSPLRLVFPGDGLAGDLILRGTADADGAFVAQEFTFYVTTFVGVPFDASHTAVPA